MSSNDRFIAAKPTRNSRTGILSIVVGILAILGVVLFEAIIRFDWFPDDLYVILIIALVVGFFTILGIGLGISSLIQKNNRKLFGIVGCTLNVLVFTSFCLVPSIDFINTTGFPPAIRDGCILGTAKAWIDLNENGIWDSNEYPLSDVQIFVYDDSKNYDFIQEEAISNNQGEAIVDIWPYTCNSLDGEVQVIIQATPPKGYKTTTPTQVTITSEDMFDFTQQDYFFGFIKETPP